MSFIALARSKTRKVQRVEMVPVKWAVPTTEVIMHANGVYHPTALRVTLTHSHHHKQHSKLSTNEFTFSPNCEVQNISASQLRHCCCCIKTLKHNTCKLNGVLFMLQRGLFGLTSTLFTCTTLMRVLVYAFSTLHRSLIKRITILYQKQEYWIIKDRHAIFTSSSFSASPTGHIWGWRWLQLCGS